MESNAKGRMPLPPVNANHSTLVSVVLEEKKLEVFGKSNQLIRHRRAPEPRDSSENYVTGTLTWLGTRNDFMTKGEPPLKEKKPNLLSTRLLEVCK